MNFRPFIFSLISFSLLWSCSTQKNRMLNRGYHELNSQYNVLFNGEEAFKIGLQILEETYEDNFYELLAIEPIMLRGEQAESSTIVPGFERAEEKAVKTIQKHSMNIEGEQRNSVIDQAYLLLGKARYYDRRYFPALETFNYLMKNAVDPTAYPQIRIWREKTQIRLNNNELAIDNLRALAENLTPKSPDKGPANATLAAAHLNIAQKDSALIYIKTAALTEYNKRLRARYLFITGQLFEEFQQRDSTRWAYAQIVEMNRRIPRKFWMQAKIRSLQLSTEGTTADFQKALDKYLKLYENRIYAHWLHMAKAERWLAEDQDSLSLEAFQRALKSPAVDAFTRQKIYRQLSDWNYEQGAYLDSGKYLDSLLALMPADTREKRKLQRQREGMETLFQVEQSIQETDSVLTLLRMTPEEQKQYFADYIQKIKEAEAAKTPQEKSRFNLFGSRDNQFYFYNEFLKEQGKLQFAERWGDRPNVDNWRWSSASSLKQDLNALAETQSTELNKKPQLTVDGLLATLPPAESQDSILKVNHRVRLQAAILYKEKFNDIQLSQHRLASLLKEPLQPETEVQVLYHSCKNGDALGELTRPLRQQLQEKYPESPYTKVLLDPNLADIGTINTPEKKINALRAAFEKGDYEELINNYGALEVFFSGSPYLPALELLKVHVEGRLQGKTHWKKRLGDFIRKYPEDPLAKAVEKQLNLLNRESPVKIRKLQSWKWVFPLVSDERSQIDTLSQLFNKWILEQKLPWTLSQDRYDPETLFIVLHQVRNRLETDSLRPYFPESAVSKLTSNNFVVLSDEYQKTLQEKTWNKSLESTDEKQ